MSSVTRTAVKPLGGGVGYELKGIEEWAAEAVEATFDGGGAASDFLACLSLYSPGGALMSRSFPDDAITAGDTAKVTFAPFLRKTGGAAAAGASALPWAIAEHADYAAADYFSGVSPNPLSFRHFAGNDATAFAFTATGSPTAGDGDVTILRSGLYLVRLRVSARLRLAGSDPGYDWDMAVYVQGQDGGGGFFFGPDLFTGATVVQPVASYAFYLNPRNNFGAPNGNSMLGRREQQVETETYLNLPDSVVTWPVTVQAQFRHGLNDADVTTPAEYNLWLTRVGDANAAAPTT
jgi:hypothetical protein